MKISDFRFKIEDPSVNESYMSARGVYNLKSEISKLTYNLTLRIMGSFNLSSAAR